MSGSTETPRPARLGALGWVLVALALGTAIGVAISLLVGTPPGPPGPGGGAGPGPAPLVRPTSILSGVDLVLVLALLFVYLRTYSETRARFAAGLSLFLAALTLQTVFTSPLLFGVFGFGPGGLAPFLLVSATFETVALAVFLYLSLD
jgi:uncharacterized membrane protein YedE/YeeE